MRPKLGTVWRMTADKVDYPALYACNNRETSNRNQDQDYGGQELGHIAHCAQPSPSSQLEYPSAPEHAIRTGRPATQASGLGKVECNQPVRHVWRNFRQSEELCRRVSADNRDRMIFYGEWIQACARFGCECSQIIVQACRSMARMCGTNSNCRPMAPADLSFNPHSTPSQAQSTPHITCVNA